MNRHVGMGYALALSILLVPAAHAGENAGAQAWLTWSSAGIQSDLTTPGASNNLYVRVEGAGAFKGGELDLTWNPVGDGDQCAALTGTQFKTSTVCSYLNRGTAVSVTNVDEPGHLHVAWSNDQVNTGCTTGGNIIVLTFEYDGCEDATGCVSLGSLTLLDGSNDVDSASVTGATATILGGAEQCALPRSETIAAIPDQAVTVGGHLSVSPDLENAGNAVASWSGNNLPSGAHVDNSSGELEWTPQPGQVGTYSGVSILATTTTSFGVSFDIEVTEPTPHRAYAATQLIVQFAPGLVTPETLEPGRKGNAPRLVANARATNALQSIGGTIVRQLAPHSGGAVVDASGDSITLPCDLRDLYLVAVGDTNVLGDLALLTADTSSVIFAEPDYLFHAAYQPSDSLYPQEWWLQSVRENYCSELNGSIPTPTINASKAWDVYLPVPSGYHSFVGLLDTGLDMTHPEFPYAIEGYDFTYEGSVQDEDGHGTAVGGVIAAMNDLGTSGVVGVNWNVSLVPIRIVLDHLDDAQASTIISAYDFASGNGIGFTNLSFEATGGSSVALAQMLKDRHATGWCDVVAMGNENGHVSASPANLRYFTEAVAAILPAARRWDDNQLDGQLCPPFITGAQGSNWGDWVDIAAPGGHAITTTDLAIHSGYLSNQCSCNAGFFGGTSVATGMVTGAATFIHDAALDRGISLDGEDILHVLNTTAADIAPTGFDDSTGWGGLDLYNAVEVIRSSQSVVQAHAGTPADVGYTTVSGGMQFVGTTGFTDNFAYPAERHEFRATVTFPEPFADVPLVWGKLRTSVGATINNPHKDYQEPVGWSEVVPGSISESGCVLRTYVYVLKNGNQIVGYYPHGATILTPPIVSMDYTAIGADASLTGIGSNPLPGGDVHVVSLRQVQKSLIARLETSVTRTAVVRVLDVSGRCVWDGVQALHAGTNEIRIATTSGGQPLRSGVYFVHIVADKEELPTSRAVFIR